MEILELKRDKISKLIEEETNFDRNYLGLAFSLWKDYNNTLSFFGIELFKHIRKKIWMLHKILQEIDLGNTCISCYEFSITTKLGKDIRRKEITKQYP